MLWDNGCVRQTFAQGKAFGFVPAGEEAVVPDLHKARRKDVQKKTADKFVSGQRHDFPAVIILVIPPFERDPAILHTKDAVIGDGDPVCVAAKILHHTGGVLKGRLAVDNPFLLITIVQQPVPISRIFKTGAIPMKPQTGFFEIIQEFSTEEPG